MYTELIVGVAGVAGVFLVKNLLTGTKKALFRIWTKALKETLVELGLEDEGHFEVLYKVLEKLHKTDVNTMDLEEVMLDELTKK